MIDRDPIQTRPEIPLHLHHKLAGVGLEIIQARAVLGGDDESELMTVLDTAISESIAVGMVCPGVIDLTMSTVAIRAIPLEIPLVVLRRLACITLKYDHSGFDNDAPCARGEGVTSEPRRNRPAP